MMIRLPESHSSSRGFDRALLINERSSFSHFSSYYVVLYEAFSMEDILMSCVESDNDAARSFDCLETGVD